MGLIIMLLGTALVLLVLFDLLLAVLHLDSGGLFLPGVHRGQWSLCMFLARRFPAVRRQLLALAGPVMIVSTFLLWIGGFILGFALIFWANLDQFRSEAELGPLSFIDALYYSGITGTVLGYGDISPLSGGLKVLAFVESGLGFAMLTGIVTYLLNVLSGVSERNAMTQRLHIESGGSADGTVLLVRSCRAETPDQVHERFRQAFVDLERLREKMQRFPILDLYYRSHDLSYNPEVLLRTLADLALAGRMVAGVPDWRGLDVVSEDLDEAVKRLMLLLSRQYFGAKLHDLQTESVAEEEDRTRIVDLRRRLEWELRISIEVAGERERLLTTIAGRHRLFFTALDRYTGWWNNHQEAQVT
jgi:hypothetical protein